MDTAVRYEPDQMQGALSSFRRLQRFTDSRIVEETAILDGVTDLHQILTHDLPATEREMANFRITHLPVWQTNRLAGRFEYRQRVFGVKLVELRRFCDGNRIVLAGGIDPDAVHYDKNDRATRRK